LLLTLLLQSLYNTNTHRYTLPLTLKEIVLGKKLLANGEGALVYNGGKLNKGTASSHKENLYGTYWSTFGASLIVNSSSASSESARAAVGAVGAVATRFHCGC
jgi:hypothetical protein